MKMIGLLLISLACFQGSLGYVVDIIGGNPANIENYPYVASIFYNATTDDGRIIEIQGCDAVIISTEWLATAGHCVGSSHPDVKDMKVRTGVTMSDDTGERHEVKQAIKHPKFKVNRHSATNDIGLIQLAKPIKFSKVQNKVSLARSNNLSPGNTLLIAGFGASKLNENNSKQLRVAYVPIDSLQQCKLAYPADPIDDSMICAGNSKTSSCYGDSGGPALWDDKLVGIISSGIDCDTTKSPAIFTAVFKQIDWISEYVKDL